MRALYDLPAPAKLNLFLHVLGRRADGYHLLQSVFMLVDLCDTLHFERRPDGQISREDLSDLSLASASSVKAQAALPANDLCVRAAQALQAGTGSSQGCHISLQKRIPQQAGMGGGSSDAATCLLALNRLWGLGLSLAQLEPIGLALGADVPFFLRRRNAWVEGVGERITPIALPAQRFVLLKPPSGLDTAAVFSSPHLKRDTETAIIQGFATNANGAIYQWGRNDLEAVARGLCPEVGAAIDWLQTLGLQARMTGSGSAVFAPLPSSRSVDFGLGSVQAPSGFWLKTCSNLQSHPLLGW